MRQGWRGSKGRVPAEGNTGAEAGAAAKAQEYCLRATAVEPAEPGVSGSNAGEYSKVIG